MADSVRKSTSRRQDVVAVDSLQSLLDEQISLISFHICESAGRSRECDESIRWEWLNEGGFVIEEGAASQRTSNAYNTYSNFKPDAVGSYQLRMYNAQNHMIGRRTFVVQ